VSEVEPKQPQGWFRHHFPAVEPYGICSFLPGASVYTSAKAVIEAADTEAQAGDRLDTPDVVKVVFFVAVFLGADSGVLVLRQAFAKPLLIVSLIGVVAQSMHICFPSHVLEVVAPGPLPMAILAGFGLIASSASSLKRAPAVAHGCMTQRSASHFVPE